MFKGKLGAPIGLLTLILSSFFCLKMPLEGKMSLSEQVSKDFTAAAKKAIPAVVSIQVKEIEKESSKPSDSSYGDPFQDEFFERFFGRKSPRAKPKEQPSIGQASGFIVSKDGYIITNNHVVTNASEISVTLDDEREFQAKVVGRDPNTDLAVIKIEGNNLPFLELGNSDNLEVGQWVLAVGNPLGLKTSVTVGIVSAKGRNNLDIARIEDFIQTDAPINRGNSGGPLVNLDGEVVGVNTAIVSNLSSGGYIGIGFAIPSNIALNVLDQIIKNGSVSRGFLGVQLQTIDKDLAEAFGLDRLEGALIAEIQTGSAAQKAGLRTGDIILKYNDTKVTNLAGLRNAIAMMPPRSKIKLTFLRDGKLNETQVELGVLKTDTEETPVIKSKSLLGLEVAELTKDAAITFGYVNERGVIVTNVEPGSAASFTGIKKGALIISVNQKNVATVDEFKKYVKETAPGKPVLFLIKQGDVTRYVSIKLG